MKQAFHKLIWMMLGGLVAGAMGACNTMAGAGEDIENAGEGIQNAAD